MECSRHHWVIGEDGNAHCRDCLATKKFPPPDESMELTPAEKVLVEHYNSPPFWKTGSLCRDLDLVDAGGR